MDELRAVLAPLQKALSHILLQLSVALHDGGSSETPARTADSLSVAFALVVLAVAGYFLVSDLIPHDDNRGSVYSRIQRAWWHGKAAAPGACLGAPDDGYGAVDQGGVGVAPRPRSTTSSTSISNDRPLGQRVEVPKRIPPTLSRSLLADAAEDYVRAHVHDEAVVAATTAGFISLRNVSLRALAARTLTARLEATLKSPQFITALQQAARHALFLRRDTAEPALQGGARRLVAAASRTQPEVVEHRDSEASRAQSKQSHNRRRRRHRQDEQQIAASTTSSPPDDSLLYRRVMFYVALAHPFTTVEQLPDAILDDFCRRLHAAGGPPVPSADDHHDVDGATDCAGSGVRVSTTTRGDERPSDNSPPQAVVAGEEAIGTRRTSRYSAFSPMVLLQPGQPAVEASWTMICSEAVQRAAAGTDNSVNGDEFSLDDFDLAKDPTIAMTGPQVESSAASFAADGARSTGTCTASITRDLGGVILKAHLCADPDGTYDRAVFELFAAAASLPGVDGNSEPATRVQPSQLLEVRCELPEFATLYHRYLRAPSLSNDIPYDVPRHRSTSANSTGYAALAAAHLASLRPTSDTVSRLAARQGRTGSETGQQASAIQDVAALTWMLPQPAAKQPPASRLWQSAVVTRGNKIITFGGFQPTEAGGPSSGHASSELRMYDTVTRTWVDFSSLPTQPPGAYFGHASVAMGQRMLVLGGTGSPSAEDLSRALMLDTASLTWALIPLAGSPPAPRMFHTAVAHGSLVYVHGGISPSASAPTVFKDTFILDCTDMAWMVAGAAGATTRSSMCEPGPRYGHSAVLFHATVDGAGGGARSSLGCDTAPASCSDGECDAEGEDDALASARGPFMIVFGGKPEIGGGPAAAREDTHALDLSSHRWHALHTSGRPPPGAVFHSAAIAGRFMLVAGGFREAAVATPSDSDEPDASDVAADEPPAPGSASAARLRMGVHLLDLHTLAWTSPVIDSGLSLLPFARFGLAGALVDPASGPKLARTPRATTPAGSFSLAGCAQPPTSPTAKSQTLRFILFGGASAATGAPSTREGVRRPRNARTPLQAATIEIGVGAVHNAPHEMQGRVRYTMRYIQAQTSHTACVEPVPGCVTVADAAPGGADAAATGRAGTVTAGGFPAPPSASSVATGDVVDGHHGNAVADAMAPDIEVARDSTDGRGQKRRKKRKPAMRGACAATVATGDANGASCDAPADPAGQTGTSSAVATARPSTASDTGLESGRPASGSDADDVDANNDTDCGGVGSSPPLATGGRRTEETEMCASDAGASASTWVAPGDQACDDEDHGGHTDAGGEHHQDADGGLQAPVPGVTFTSATGANALPMPPTTTAGLGVPASMWRRQRRQRQPGTGSTLEAVRRRRVAGLAERAPHATPRPATAQAQSEIVSEERVTAARLAEQLRAGLLDLSAIRWADDSDGEHPGDGDENSDRAGARGLASTAEDDVLVADFQRRLGLIPLD